MTPTLRSASAFASHGLVLIVVADRGKMDSGPRYVDHFIGRCQIRIVNDELHTGSTTYRTALDRMSQAALRSPRHAQPYNAAKCRDALDQRRLVGDLRDHAGLKLRTDKSLILGPTQHSFGGSLIVDPPHLSQRLADGPEYCPGFGLAQRMYVDAFPLRRHEYEIFDTQNKYPTQVRHAELSNELRSIIARGLNAVRPALMIGAAVDVGRFYWWRRRDRYRRRRDDETSTSDDDTTGEEDATGDGEDTTGDDEEDTGDDTTMRRRAPSRPLCRQQRTLRLLCSSQSPVGRCTPEEAILFARALLLMRVFETIAWKDTAPWPSQPIRACLECLTVSNVVVLVFDSTIKVRFSGFILTWDDNNVSRVRAIKERLELDHRHFTFASYLAGFLHKHGYEPVIYGDVSLKAGETACDNGIIYGSVISRGASRSSRRAVQDHLHLQVIITGTVEDKILEMQKKKQATTDQVLIFPILLYSVYYSHVAL
ncbi:hypothetical protein BDZ89DRAFT_1221896 [Hymenopellis radicata]|nr:hypothetical protein BDZ89DRAFT_1221896 [Hymenopellis radicata]